MSTIDQQESSEWGTAEFMEAADGMAPWALRAAATLRLADHIAGGAMTAASLAQRSETDPTTLAMLMRFLVSRGVFSDRPGEGFGLTALSVQLLDRHPGGLRGWLDQSGVGARMDRALGQLLPSVRSGRPSYPEVFGQDFYTDMYQHQAAQADRAEQSFALLRATHAQQFAAAIADELDWANTRSVVDVGGGTGQVLHALLHRWPLLVGCLVDLPEVLGPDPSAPAAAFAQDDAGILARFSAAPGSFFDPLPPGADVYLLVNVLHNWPDQDVVRILGQCREAATEAEVLVIERLTDDLDPQTATAMNLRMFLLSGGAERSEADFRRLAREAGLEVTENRELSHRLRALRLRPRSTD
jgi:2,7-dihydroxy-5-methyl-1-naphthoate 7-O-methyltransferase